MDLDPLTADHPDRTLLEDEEAAAEAGAAELGRAPVVLWTPATRAAMQDGVLRPRVLVVAATPAACALLRPAASDAPLAGSIVLPGTSLAGCTLPPGPTDAACGLTWADAAHTTLVARAAAPPPADRAPAIADAVLACIDADATVVVGAVPAHVVPGGGGEEGGEAAYVLASTAAADTPLPAPPLPPGVALTGLPAALFSRRQAAGARAIAVAGVDAGAGAPSAAALSALASALAAALTAAGAPVDVVNGLAKPVAAAVALDEADVVTSRSAVYV